MFHQPGDFTDGSELDSKNLFPLRLFLKRAFPAEAKVVMQREGSKGIQKGDSRLLVRRTYYGCPTILPGNSETLPSGRVSMQPRDGPWGTAHDAAVLMVPSC